MLRQLVAITLACGCAASLAQDREGLRALEQADANKDGSVSKAEYLEARAQQFGKLDRNADGYIDDADAPTRAEGQPQRNRGAGRMREEFDTNKDGKIAKAEFVEAPAPVFDLADTDRNGMLSVQEIETVRSLARERAGRGRRGAQQ